MTLTEKIKQVAHDNLDFIIASATYVTANVADYLLTLHSMNNLKLGEFHPVAQYFITNFGVESGLLTSKLCVCGITLLDLKRIDSAYKNNQTKVKAEYLLYPGSLLTAFGGISWLILHGDNILH